MGAEIISSRGGKLGIGELWGEGEGEGGGGGALSNMCSP